MREIKFRAWDSNKKEMHLPEYSDKEVFHILADGSIVETHEHGYERHELTSHRNGWELMQFTGLLDKNGNGDELYDGDLITNTSRNGGKPHPIKWSEIKGAWVGDYGVQYLIAEELNEITKVGNIYETERK